MFMTITQWRVSAAKVGFFCNPKAGVILVAMHHNNSCLVPLELVGSKKKHQPGTSPFN